MNPAKILSNDPKKDKKRNNLESPMVAKSHKKLRWMLRGLSALIILFSLLMFIGETYIEENSGNPLTKSAILQLSIAGIGLLGLGLAWKWELIGGVVSLVAFVVLAIINPIVLSMELMYVWPLVAVLFIVLWRRSRSSSPDL